MRIISSSATADPPRSDGKFWAHETHTTDNAAEPVILFNYLAAAGLDYQQVALDRAAEMNANWEAQENAVPEEVSAGQFRRALVAANLREVAETAIAQSPEANNVWFTTERVRRDDPLVEIVRVGLNIPPEDMDEVFKAADDL